MASPDGKRKELPKRYQGVEVCAPHGNTTICVRGAKFGFSGELKPASGGAGLPLITDHHPRDQSKPVREARTPQQAIKNARAFLRRVKRNQR